MGTYDQRPWLPRYRPEYPHDVEPEFSSALAMFEDSLRRAPETEIVRYFDGTLTLAELDRLSDQFAVALADRGFEKGQRLATYLQNIPQVLIAAIGTWKAGGIVVSINPMSRVRELTTLLSDCEATALLAEEDLFGQVAAEVVPTIPSLRIAWTTSPLEFQTRHDPRLFGGMERTRHDGTEDMSEVLASVGDREPEPVELELDDAAFLGYTSGTTGPPKGAMNTHRNVVFNARVYREWCGLTPEDSVLGVAPLFHITGVVAHTAVCLLVPMPLVLAYRFEPNVMLDAIREHRPTFTAGSITVFIALMNTEGAVKEDLSSLAKIYSGGAPIPPSTVKAFSAHFGHYIHNIYGLTETTSPSHGTPRGSEAPVDEASGALSVGVPVFSTVVRIMRDDGSDAEVGEVGEIVTRGPQVVPGYWNKPEETENALRAPDGSVELKTGDVGYMDDQGWFYVVDRKKDQINAGGYKVWPREVEDVLYEHPAVREAAVVGVPDEYRGETVKAFVSVRPGQSVEPDELIQFCKERMSAYKYPRQVELMDEIPKTVTGKLLRRALRS
ncbi:long-chain acyl-CoA synthetase [Actinomycetospora succinea]|uniref:Long-chain acyl-CoA synthetase n=1 Tax=Actinomycetospora succinea TaxID=663603 RepID=A0A4R6UUY5_9PSEU|nr:AMP-binding protein [Actinomycetospora succinea]TDQ51012.1 long-chain acyl-CoA synthetase [Actinomycetospora succinea]